MTSIFWGTLLVVGSAVAHKLLGKGRSTRARVYTLLTVALACFYALFLLTLKHIFASTSSANSTVVLLLLFAAIAATFTRLRSHARYLIDRLIYRDRYDYARTLRTVGARLASLQPLDDVLSSIANDLCRAMNLTGVAILLRRGNGMYAVGGASGECCDATVARNLIHIAETNPESHLDGWIPLIANDEEQGLLYVGAKRIASDLTRDDLTLIETLASQAGVALANAVLVDRLRSQVSAMELLRDRILQAQDEERKRLAELIHDDILGVILQVLGGIESAMRLLPVQNEVVTHLSRAARAGDYVGYRLREIATELYPTTLRVYGLGPAIKQLVDETNRCETFAVTISCAAFPEGCRLAETVEEIVYRTVRQLLDNVRRHAHATVVVINVVLNDEGLVVSVRDDGRGFVPQPLLVLLRSGHLGLVSCRERVEDLGGTMSIHSAPGEGAEIWVHLPASIVNLIELPDPVAHLT